jgi:hypothetical protein
MYLAIILLSRYRDYLGDLDTLDYLGGRLLAGSSPEISFEARCT